MEHERQDAANRMTRQILAALKPEQDVVTIAGALSAVIAALGLSAPDIATADRFVDTISFAAKQSMRETWSDPGRQSGRVPH